MTEFSSKQELVEYVVSLFSGRWGEGYLHTSGNSLSREKDPEEVFYFSDFCDFLEKRHPNLSREDVQEIYKQVKWDDKSFHDFNRFFFKKLREGFLYKRARDGSVHSIKLIDFENINLNTFRVVDKLNFSFDEFQPNREISSGLDLVIYINGIPFIVWTFQDPKKKLEGTEAIIQWDLMVRFQEIFKYNAFCVICNGMEGTKYGIPWDKYSNYKEWKRVNEYKEAENENILLSTIKGLFNKARLISILENFICFSDSSSSRKIICRYPQYFGAIKLLKSILEHSRLREEGDGKGGIYFGAAGCGKSYTMLFLSRLLLKSQELSQPTVLLITDRLALQNQLNQLFCKHKEFLQCNEIEKMESGMDLKNTLRYQVAGGIYFTTIHKFRSLEGIELSDRKNIVCIADEAHRSHDKWNVHITQTEQGEPILDQPLSQVLRNCLPNATYVGFTATPKNRTLFAFGNIVDVYGMKQSEYDGFTVPIHFDWIQKTRLICNEDMARQIGLEYQESASSGISAIKIREDYKARTFIGKTFAFEERLKIVAKDIVEYYERRVKGKETVAGKAMIIAQSKASACTYYKTLKELRPEWFESESPDYPEQAKVNIIISKYEKGDPEIEQFARDTKQQGKFLNEFKKADSTFKIAIVCEMWLTGVDIPSLDTLFLDKWITDSALLIQAICRVNRSYPNKKVGLVVSYMSLQEKLDKAKEELRELGGASEIVYLNNVVEQLRRSWEALDSLFQKHYANWTEEVRNYFVNASSSDKVKTVKKMVDWINRQDTSFVVDFATLSRELMRNYEKCKNSDSVNDTDRKAVMFFGYLRKIWKEPTEQERNMREKLDEYTQQVFTFQEITRRTSEILDMGEELPSNFDIEGEIPREMKTIDEIKEEGQMFNSVLEGSNYALKADMIAEGFKAIENRYNTLWDEGIQAVKQKGQRPQGGQKGTEYTEEMEAKLREEAILNTISRELITIKDKYSFDCPEQKINDLSLGLKEINDKYLQYKDWDEKVLMESKFEKDMILFLWKEKWSQVQSVIEETTKRLLSIFKKMAETNRQERSS